MDQQPVFITAIDLLKVRHLEQVHIQLSETERKHLILTGRNGSGKTSVLEMLSEVLPLYLDIEKYNNLKYAEGVLKNEEKIFENNIKHKERFEIQKMNYANISKGKNSIYNIFFNRIEAGLHAYFDAKHKAQFKIPKGIEKVALKQKYSVKDHANTDFLQYIVNLRADRSFARDENDESAVNQIDAWFQRFEHALRDIFSDPTLTLTFDRANYNFTIHQQGHEPFDLNTLSDGYSAILSIVTELMMRMEGTGAKAYDAQGVVLIDEIETHLHIELQKKILPFLTAFFPHIQFIVSTHSPFVLGSIPNAVIFDLEHQQPVEDLTAYSVEAIIEAYFGQDKYADYLKHQVEQYERLINQDVLTETELTDLNRLETDLNRSPQFFKAPELELKLRMLNRARRKKHPAVA